MVVWPAVADPGKLVSELTGKPHAEKSIGGLDFSVGLGMCKFSVICSPGSLSLSSKSLGMSEAVYFVY